MCWILRCLARLIAGYSQRPPWPSVVFVSYFLLVFFFSGMNLELPRKDRPLQAQHDNIKKQQRRARLINDHIYSLIFSVLFLSDLPDTEAWVQRFLTRQPVAVPTPNSPVLLLSGSRAIFLLVYMNTAADPSIPRALRRSTSSSSLHRVHLLPSKHHALQLSPVVTHTFLNTRLSSFLLMN